MDCIENTSSDVLLEGMFIVQLPNNNLWRCTHYCGPHSQLRECLPCRCLVTTTVLYCRLNMLTLPGNGLVKSVTVLLVFAKNYVWGVLRVKCSKTGNMFCTFDLMGMWVLSECMLVSVVACVF
jgi:hypothetical protein